LVRKNILAGGVSVSSFVERINKKSMQKSVLLEIVRSLNRKEIREVQKWLQSPAHNQRQDVIQLFDHLAKTLMLSDKEVDKEMAWKVIFPGRPYDDAYMRQVMYFLLKSLENYLVFAEISKNPVHIQSMLLKVYRARQLERSFRLTIETARKQQTNSPYRNSSFLQEQHLIEQEQYYYLVGQKWSTELNLQETANAFDLAYIADKMRLSCRMLSHQAYKKVSYDMGALQPILSYVETAGLLKEPAISMYYYGFKALTEPDNESFFEELERILFENEKLFPIEEVRELYLLAINYCISRINAGMDSYLHKAFKLYKLGFENDILLENGVVSKMSFGNAVSSAIKIREFAWAESFVQKFQMNLEEKFRESMTNFNLARIYFEKGDYERAQQLLAKFEYDDMVLNLVAKTMLLKIYYEASDYDIFESLLDSMRTYLQRKDAISPNHRVVYKNFLGVMRRLIHLNPYSKTQVEKFRDLVATTNPLIERDWLLKQLK